MSKAKSHVLPIFIVLVMVLGLWGVVQAKDPVKITFWHAETQPIRVQTFQTIIDRFEAENPGIKVSQAAYPNADMFPKITAALLTDTGPDMAFSTPERAMAIRKMGFGEPVDDLVAKIDETYKYVPKPKTLYYFDGHYWAVPVWSITIMLYYRDDLLKQHGFDEPPRTWDELLTMARTFSEAGKFGIGLPASSGQNCTEQVVWSFLSTKGAQVYDEEGNIVFNNPKTVETYDYLVELAKYSPPDCTGWSWAETKLSFTSGSVPFAFLFGSILLDLVQQTDFADEVKAVTIPIPEDGKHGGLTHTEGVMVYTKDKAKQEACAKFIEFFFRPDNYGWFLANMQPGLALPITETGMASKEFWEHPILARFEDIMNAQLEQVWTGSLFGFEYEKRNPYVGEIGVSFILAETLQRAVTKQLTVEKAVEWGHNRMLSITED